MNGIQEGRGDTAFCNDMHREGVDVYPTLLAYLFAD
jgi:hypothetical protein